LQQKPTLVTIFKIYKLFLYKNYKKVSCYLIGQMLSDWQPLKEPESEVEKSANYLMNMLELKKTESDPLKLKKIILFD
jgi:hypothetical protein